MWNFFKHRSATQQPTLVRRLLIKNKTFIDNEDGATAIEFAILGLPFLALLFGIIELAVVFFISSTAQHALETTAREIRTGEFQFAGGDETSMLNNICSNMGNDSTLSQCRSKLQLDIATGTSFSTVALPDSAACVGSAAQIAACKALNPAVSSQPIPCTSGGDIVVVRLQYFHKLSIPSSITRLANAGNNTRVIAHTTAFRNEPFSHNCP